MSGRIDVAELQAGVELDNCVAESQGWVDIEYDDNIWYGRPPGTELRRRIPQYGSDPNVAWALYRKLIENAEQASLDYDTDYGADGKSGWSVTIDGIVLTEFAPTPELAICGAAIVWPTMELD